MQIYVNIKTAGKRKNILTKKPYTIPEDIRNLRDLLSWFTRKEVEVYNSGDESARLPILDPNQLSAGAEVGKISFGYRQDTKKVDPEQAVEVTISAYQDGLVRVFLNELELEKLEEEITLKENDCLTFMRLTFLSGRMW